MPSVFISCVLIASVVSVNGYKFLSKILPDSFSTRDSWADATHCYDKKITCNRALWAQLTCDQSCVCKGYHSGTCTKSHKICTPRVPWVCKCYGRWFGRDEEFCKHRNHVPSRENDKQ